MIALAPTLRLQFDLVAQGGVAKLQNNIVLRAII